MKLVKLLGACLVAAIPLPEAVAAGVDAELRAAVVVAARQVTLGDLAALHGDPAAVAALAALPIASTPPPGHAARLSREEVARRVRARARSVDVSWAGAPAVKVESAARDVSGAHLARVAVAHVLASLAPAGAALQARAAHEPRSVEVPPGELELRPRPLAADAAGHDRVEATIDVFVDGRFARAVAVPVTLDRPAAARLPAVRRGDTVKLLLRNAMLSLEASAVAQSDAVVGEAVWVRRGAGGGPLRARVVAAGEVEMEEP